jgi:hypothetical protein
MKSSIGLVFVLLPLGLFEIDVFEGIQAFANLGIPTNPTQPTN